MVLNKIEKLVEKYENGETSIAEEQELKRFFTESDVPEHLEVYKSLFTYFSVNQQETFNKALPLKKTPVIPYKWLTAVAATVVLLLGFYLGNRTKNQDLGTFNDPELAFMEVSKSLEMISTKFNQGASTVGYLDEVNKGTSTLNYLNEMENATQIIFKKEKK
ncbi:hypothetical protein [Pseudotamlana agarivorans]|uniref:hypothetical protein n=1 Tax=Pseudotamlana agarivorans TaxID=481183 RepID=UPI0008344534|nr:hypothetical protein [Tamlana agarivorans]